MRLLLAPFAHDGVLATASLGQRVFAHFVQQTPVARERPEVAYLDFQGIEVATASFLREAVLGFRNYARQHCANVYPVVANASSNVREELEELLRTRGDVCLVCSLDDADRPSGARIAGQLDEHHVRTLSAVAIVGEADAGTLAATQLGEEVGATAWNNRLNALAAKGLLIESSAGRSKRYRQVFEGLSYGT